MSSGTKVNKNIKGTKSLTLQISSKYLRFLSGMMNEILAYFFIGFFVVLPAILKLKACLAKYEHPVEHDPGSLSQLTLRVPENGGVE